MNRLWTTLFPVACVVVIAISGCHGESANDRLAGTWVLDAEATLELPAHRALAKPELEAFRRTLKATSTEVTFASGKVTRKSSVADRDGRYESEEGGPFRIVTSKRDRVVISFTNEDGERRRMALDFDGDRLVMEIDEAKSVLRRK